jgi:hypothetical protein
LYNTPAHCAWLDRVGRPDGIIWKSSGHVCFPVIGDQAHRFAHALFPLGHSLRVTPGGSAKIRLPLLLP